MQSHLLCRTCFSQYQASHAVSGKLSREKTFTNWWKIWFSWRKLLRIALFCRAKGCHTPKFRGEKTFANSHKTAKFAKFSLSKVSRYTVHCVYMHIQCTYMCTWMSKELRAGGCQVFLSHWSENQIKRETLSCSLILQLRDTYCWSHDIYLCHMICSLILQLRDTYCWSHDIYLCHMICSLILQLRDTYCWSHDTYLCHMICSEGAVDPPPLQVVLHVHLSRLHSLDTERQDMHMYMHVT